MMLYYYFQDAPSDIPTADEQISTMLLPDFSGNSREKDIHVHNFNLTFGGQILLDSADLRIVYGKVSLSIYHKLSHNQNDSPNSDFQGAGMDWLDETA